MAAFSYEHHHHLHQSLFLDPAYIIPSNTIDLVPAPAPHQPGGDLTDNINNSSSSFHCFYSPTATITEVSTNDVSSSSLDTKAKGRSTSSSPSPSSSSMEKKRTALSNDLKEGRRRKQKKCGNGVKVAATTAAAAAGDEQQQPSGYIHVRARRGEATDSHSLAERVRREKISERMKLLQGLVPGCDKVIGKALMLDEIINYVQSLQNQVEFLSMKLASVSPTLYEYGALDLDDHYMLQTHKMEGMPSSSLQETTHIQPTGFAETADNYPMVDTTVPFLLHGQGPSSYHHQEQDGFGATANVVDDGQRFLHQFQHFNNMCSFQ